MITALKVLGVVLALNGLFLLGRWWSARRRAAGGRIPPGLPVLTFRPGTLVSDDEEAELAERYAQQQALGRALRGKRWTPPPQVRA